MFWPDSPVGLRSRGRRTFESTSLQQLFFFSFFFLLDWAAATWLYVHFIKCKIRAWDLLPDKSVGNCCSFVLCYIFHALPLKLH